MSLEQIYTRFLSAPRVEVLDPSVTFHYITTAVSINGPEKIISQLQRENLKQLKKRVEKVLAAVATGNSLVLEVETEIEFLTSGANWLPGLDDNFLADHVVRFPVVHIVNFEGKLIKEVRLYWDQANILKQLNVIGRSGRNWPIKDGVDQIKMIVESISRHSVSTPVAQNGGAYSTREARSQSQGRENAMRDPHASLHLFQSADEDVPIEKPRAPRSNSTFRPPSRDLEAIIGESDEPPQPMRPSRSSSAFRPPSRDLESIIGESNEPPQQVKPPKSRGSFSQGKTFDLGDQHEERVDTPKAIQRTPNVNAQKYQHFEFGDGDDRETEPSVFNTRPLPGARSKNAPSWDFEDFVTPEKRPMRHRPDDKRHFDWSEEDDKKPIPAKSLSNAANALNNARRNDTSQFEIADNSPADGASEAQRMHDRPGKSDRNKSGYQWTAHQNALDDDNAFFGGFGKETVTSGIHITGDGRGTNKNASKNWSWDLDSPSAAAKKDHVPGKTQRG